MGPVDIAYSVSLGRGGSTGSGKDEGFLLPDSEYLKTHGYFEKAAEAAQKANRIGGAVGRGLKQRQGRFLEALGLGGSYADKAKVTLAPGVRKIGLELNPGVQEAYMAEINKGMETLRGVRQNVSSGLSTGASLEGIIGGAILKSNPFTAAFAPLHEGISAGKGAFYSAAPMAFPAIATAKSEEAGTLLDPQSEYERAIARISGGGDSRTSATNPTGRGGGGADFYRMLG